MFNACPKSLTHTKFYLCTQRRQFHFLLSAGGNGPTVVFTFTMNANSDYLKIGQTVTFDNEMTNIGLAFNPQLSVFQAPVSGVYHFDAVIMTHQGEDIETEIVKNGNIVVRMYSGSSASSKFGVGSQSVNLYLNALDKVWVRVTDNTIVNSGNIRIFGLNWTTFSGFLIQH